MSEKLSGKQEQALIALLTEATIEAAAAKAGVNARTLLRWRNNPAFAAAYHQARRDALSLATARLQQASGSAVDTLVSLMDDVLVSPQVRANVAKAVLEIAYRASELEDLEQRLNAIERTLNAQQEDTAQKTSGQWQ